MNVSDSVLGTFLLSQFCIGVIGNSLLFFIYVYTFIFKPHLKKPIDSTLMHLMKVNTLTIITSLISDIMASFRVRGFRNDAGCHTLLYLCRVTRGVSIGTTTILSTYQAITITSIISKWAWLKSKLSTWTFPAFLFIWVINMLINIHIIETIIAKTNSSHSGHGYSHVYCQNRHYGKYNHGMFLSILMIYDFFFEFFMIWGSLYMVNFLYRHHKRALYIHNASLSSHTSPERKATHSILLLVICFVCFYWVNIIITAYGFYAPMKISRLEGVNAILTTYYPAIYPFLLMKNNKIIWHYVSTLLRSTCFQSAFRN